jgi:hypothetical protein
VKKLEESRKRAELCRKKFASAKKLMSPTYEKLKKVVKKRCIRGGFDAHFSVPGPNRQKCQKTPYTGPNRQKVASPGAERPKKKAKKGPCKQQ